MDSELLLEVSAEDLQDFPDPEDNLESLECTHTPTNKYSIQQGPTQTTATDTPPIPSLLSLEIPTPPHLVNVTTLWKYGGRKSQQWGWEYRKKFRTNQTPYKKEDKKGRNAWNTYKT